MKRRSGKVISMVLALMMLASCSKTDVADTEERTEATADTLKVEYTETVVLTETQAESEAEPTEQTEDVLPQTLGYITDDETFIRLRMKNIMQESIGMYYGCEAVSLAIALKYYGYDADPVELFTEHMKSGAAGVANPFYSYVGDPRDNSGFGCYAPCAVRCANSYLESVGSPLRAKDISGADMDEIKSYLWEGKPVVIWGTLDMKPSDVLAVWRFGGNPVYWYNLSHCVVLSGVFDDLFFVCDPMEGHVRYDVKDVERSYNQIYTQALVIE